MYLLQYLVIKLLNHSIRINRHATLELRDKESGDAFGNRLVEPNFYRDGPGFLSLESPQPDREYAEIQTKATMV